MDLRHSFNIHLLSLHAVNTSASEGLKQRGRLTRCHLDMWETLAIIKDDIYVYILRGRTHLTEGKTWLQEVLAG